MYKEQHVEKLKKILLSMFRKEYVGIHHGSFSIKTADHRLLINTKTAVFDQLNNDDIIELDFKEDYRWKEASMDAKIHRSIYKNISSAKYIAYTTPTYIMAYAMNNIEIHPIDYFGKMLFKYIVVFDPKQYEDWYERAESEIYQALIERKNTLVVIRGYGVYIYDRDIYDLAKKIDILENSCKILYLSEQSYLPLHTQCEL